MNGWYQFRAFVKSTFDVQLEYVPIASALLRGK